MKRNVDPGATKLPVFCLLLAGMIRPFALMLLLIFSISNCVAGELPKPSADDAYRNYPEAQAKLGRLLFYDRVLSGTYRVSCATCHNHNRASSNGFILDGKKTQQNDELAVNGLPVYEALKPSSRHAPALFNLGAYEFQTLFSDGRVARKPGGDFISPSNGQLPDGLRDVLAVQALFPAVTGDELVGTVENDLKAVAHQGSTAIWNALAKRVQGLPEYLPHFQTAFKNVQTSQDISITEIANAISAFVGAEWRSDQSPFDEHLRGNKKALSVQQLHGMELFYGKAQCDSCHAGIFQTDHKFWNVDMPPWRFDADLSEESISQFDERMGRFDFTKRQSDKYAFRTPSLRNIAETAPYGHSGSYVTLKEVIDHHIDPEKALKQFMRNHSGQSGTHTPENIQRFKQLSKSTRARSPSLKENEIDDLIAFLGSLTDGASLKGRLGKPLEVPSSLALD